MGIELAIQVDNDRLRVQEGRFNEGRRLVDAQCVTTVVLAKTYVGYYLQFEEEAVEEVAVNHCNLNKSCYCWGCCRRGLKSAALKNDWDQMEARLAIRFQNWQSLFAS